MKNDLIVVKNDELYVGTWKLAKGYEVTHQAVKKILIKHKERFERVGERSFGEQIQVSNAGFEIRHKNGKKSQKRGQKDTEYLLNEAQAMFLGTLLRNTDKVLQFKETLVSEFLRQRRAINKLRDAIRNNQQNAEWLEKRASGKIERRVETDAIKEFIEYAISQGSKSAPKYYMAISKMENSALFYLEFLKEHEGNVRDTVSGMALDALKMADRIVGKTLKDGMPRRMYYKDIFQLAKARVESFADSIGKFELPIPKPIESIGEK